MIIAGSRVRIKESDGQPTQVGTVLDLEPTADWNGEWGPALLVRVDDQDVTDEVFGRDINVPIELITELFPVILLDQFSGVYPVTLEERPIQFDDLVQQVTQDPHRFRGSLRPQVLEVDESYRPPFASTVIKSGPDGRAVVWKARWDSSG